MAQDIEHNGAGYSPSLGTTVEMAMPYVTSGRTRLITNGGGANPEGARQAIGDENRLGVVTASCRCGYRTLRSRSSRRLTGVAAMP